MTAYLETPVGQLVAEKPARSRVFERWGLDYCCGGKRPLAEACRKKGLDTDAVVRDLESCDLLSPAPRVDWRSKSLSEICDHIESTHHAYLREALPRLTYLTQRVANRHGERDPRLVSLAQVFEQFRLELEDHMAKEEQILFPMCRVLATATEAPAFHCLTVLNPIRQMVAEHDDAGHGLEAMAALTNGFRPVGDECNTHRALLQALSELEADMHVHVHLENHILFPAAIAKEEELPGALA